MLAAGGGAAPRVRRVPGRPAAAGRRRDVRDVRGIPLTLRRGNTRPQRCGP